MKTRPDERHGHGRGTPEYRVWTQMIVRCHNENAPNYRLYGARGVVVCERWRSSFAAFLSDVGPRPAGTTLDRLDNDRGYEPGNVRWATPGEQAANRRSNRVVVIDGVARCATEWARIAGVSDTCLLYRLRRGISGRALLMPSRHGKRFDERAEEQGSTLSAARAGQLPLLGGVR